MTFRRSASIVQLAVFAVGGILGPVWHLAHHQNDHTHGASPSNDHHHEHHLVDAAAFAHWPQPERDGDTAPHVPIVAEGEHEHATPTEPDDSGPSQPPLDHGRGSVAHFGLVLVGAPVALPLPLPEPGDDFLLVAAIAALSLFHPPCPLQRPPPSTVS